MNAIMNLFQGATKVPAIELAVLAFVLGVVVMCLVCKVCCKPCGGKKPCTSKKDAKPQAKGEEKPFEKRKPHLPPADGSTEIYVGNLSYEMTEEQLRKEFEAFGKVNSARLVINRYNGKSKGFGFVQMPNKDEVEKAIAGLNDKEIMGRNLKCNVAKNLVED